MAEVGRGIASFIAGFAQGVAKSHIQQTLQRRQQATQFELGQLDDLVKSGDVAGVEEKLKGKALAGFFDKETQKGFTEVARRNSPEAKFQRFVTDLSKVDPEAAEALITSFAQRMGGGQAGVPALSPQGPLAGSQPVQEQTLSQGPRPGGFEQATPPIRPMTATRPVTATPSAAAQPSPALQEPGPLETSISVGPEGFTAKSAPTRIEIKQQAGKKAFSDLVRDRGIDISRATTMIRARPNLVLTDSDKDDVIVERVAELAKPFVDQGADTIDAIKAVVDKDPRLFVGLPDSMISRIYPTFGADREAISKELFDRSYIDLNTTRRGMVNTEFQNRQVEVSAAGLVEKEKIKERLPLDEKAFRWISPKTGKHAEAKMTQKEARDAGFIPVSEAAQNAVANAKAALVQIKEYRALLPRLLVKRTGNTLRDLAAVQANALAIFTKQKAGDPAAKSLLGLHGSIATLARATGDTANIAVQEREFLKEFVITTDDTQESAKEKLDRAERVLRGVAEGRGVPLAPSQPPSQPPNMLHLRVSPETGQVEQVQQ